MSHQKLLARTIGLVLAALISVGCAGVPAEPTAAPTPAPPTATPTPVPPTSTPTPTLPTATPTPAAGVGVPIASGGWQVTIKDARHETEVIRSGLTRMPGGGLGVSVSTTSAASGFTFLVVETTFRNLDPLAQTKVSAEDVAVVGIENGKSYDADDLSEPPREFVFSIEEDAVNQGFELYFRDTPPIPFSVEQEADYAFATEIGAEPGPLPYVCLADGLPALGEAGRLTFYQPEETGLVLGYVDPDGSNSTQVCSDTAFGDFQLAADGAALLLVTPHQGWPSLYLIEPEGEVYPLVTNGLNIQARFDPSDRWVLFTTGRPGGTGIELHVFDREAASTNLVQAGEWVTFDFLTDGRLITRYRETGGSDRQYYVGPPDGSALELLELPEDIADSASVSDNGQNLVYYELVSMIPTFSLFITDLDGNDRKELANSIGLSSYDALSPGSQAILMGIAKGEIVDRVELRNLDTDESWTIATGVDDADFGFSADDQWASVITTAGDQHTLYIIRTADGSMREINDAVNAFFSPDSAQLAYTVRQPDGNPEMYITPLDGEAAQLLGPGVLTGWFPHGVTTAVTTEATPTATTTARATVVASGILCQEDFSSNAKGWWVGQSPKERSDKVNQIVDGKYRISVTSKKDTFRWNSLPDFVVKDFWLSIEATLVEAAGGDLGDTNVSIVFRWTEDEDYYRARFYDDNTYKVSLRQDGDWITIYEQTPSDAIRLEPGVTNTFAILAKGSSFTIYANGRELGTVTDPTLSEAGAIGLGIGLAEGGQTATVDFDNLLIKEAPASADQ